MTPEEIIKHCFSFTDIIVGGPETGEDYLAISQKDLLTVISIAQREAVEKTKQACWEWLKALSLPEHFVEEGEEITLSTYFSKNEFFSEFTPEKILSQGK